MAKTIHTSNGKTITLLNPSEKARRFADQLKTGKVAETGEILTDSDKKYRRGYIGHAGDSAEAWCHKNNRPSKRKENRSNYWKNKKGTKV